MLTRHTVGCLGLDLTVGLHLYCWGESFLLFLFFFVCFFFVMGRQNQPRTTCLPSSMGQRYIAVPVRKHFFPGFFPPAFSKITPSFSIVPYLSLGFFAVRNTFPLFSFFSFRWWTAFLWFAPLLRAWLSPSLFSSSSSTTWSSSSSSKSNWNDLEEMVT